ncbi:helix-turn-helix domain-containing protein [Actinosynnema sp. NPDC051121]
MNDADGRGTRTKDEAGSFTALHEVFRLLGGKWDTAIFWALADGPLHWSEIRAKIQSYCEMDPSASTLSLHDSILSRALQRMQRDGLIIRVEQSAVFPRSVICALTPTAERLIEKLAPLAEWAMNHVRRNG